MADKKQKKAKKTSAKYKKYQQGKNTGKFCPKCGAGVFMAKHKDRESCGKCHYVEFKK